MLFLKFQAVLLNKLQELTDLIGFDLSTDVLQVQNLWDARMFVDMMAATGSR